MEIDDLHEMASLPIGGVYDNLIKMKDSGWTDRSKYADRTIVYKTEDKFFSVILMREGNHWSGYDYQMTEPVEVEPKLITTTIYIPKPNSEGHLSA